MLKTSKNHHTNNLYIHTSDLHKKTQCSPTKNFTQHSTLVGSTLHLRITLETSQNLTKNNAHSLKNKTHNKKLNYNLTITSEQTEQMNKDMLKVTEGHNCCMHKSQHIGNVIEQFYKDINNNSERFFRLLEDKLQEPERTKSQSNLLPGF